MKVVIDSREQNRIQSATSYYKGQGLEVEVREEQIGDYIFNDKVVFEFKTVPDFVSSIQSGRVFNQAINQAEEYDHHFVIIQGDEHSRAKAIAMSKHYREVSYFQYLGAISSLNRYTTVIESYSPFVQEAYYRMLSTATKCLQDKPIVKKFPKKHKNPAFNFLCYCVYGINSKKAQTIVDELNLLTLHDLMKIEHKDLMNIEGIGPKTASNIIRSLL